MGNSIHIFHKRTDQIENLLGAKHHHGNHKLPHRAVIQLGPEKLDLDLDAMYDESGTYVGVAVSWSQTTKQLETMVEKNQNALLNHVGEVNRQLQMVSTAALEIESSSGEVAKNAMSVESATRKFREASQDGISAIQRPAGFQRRSSKDCRPDCINRHSDLCAGAQRDHRGRPRRRARQGLQRGLPAK